MVLQLLLPLHLNVWQTDVSSRALVSSLVALYALGELGQVNDIVSGRTQLRKVCDWNI